MTDFHGELTGPEADALAGAAHIDLGTDPRAVGVRAALLARFGDAELVTDAVVAVTLAALDAEADD